MVPEVSSKPGHWPGLGASWDTEKQTDRTAALIFSRPSVCRAVTECLPVLQAGCVLDHSSGALWRSRQNHTICVLWINLWPSRPFQG